jgi:hypothetical protein
MRLEQHDYIIVLERSPSHGECPACWLVHSIGPHEQTRASGATRTSRSSGSCACLRCSAAWCAAPASVSPRPSAHTLWRQSIIGVKVLNVRLASDAAVRRDRDVERHDDDLSFGALASDLLNPPAHAPRTLNASSPLPFIRECDVSPT